MIFPFPFSRLDFCFARLLFLLIESCASAAEEKTTEKAQNKRISEDTP